MKKKYIANYTSQLTSQPVRKFYQSQAWRKVRKYIVIKYRSQCQECGKAGKIVHHIKPINSTNIYDQNITLNEDNLTLVCLDCHNFIHHYSKYHRKDVEFDENGMLIPKKT